MDMLKARSFGSLAASCALMLAMHASRAAETNPALPDWAPKPKPRVVEDRFRVEALLLSAGYDTTVRVDESLTEPGTIISAEDDLGLDDAELLAQAEVTLLPGERHLIRLNGLSSSRSAQKVLDETIVFDDEVYLPGERVDSTLNLRMIGLTYGYRFLVRQRGELTGTFGIQVADVEANAVVRSRVVRDSESGIAPLPLAGLEGRFDLSERWAFEGRIQYLTADIDEVDGEILDARAAVTWRMNPYLVFGLGYRTFSIDIDSRDPDTPGLVEMSMDGPLLFMRASL
jgi:hypothetical protein